MEMQNMKFLKELINEAKSKLNANRNVKEYDYEGDMAMSQLRSIIRNAQHMHDKLLTPTTNLPEWVQSKITLAEDYISTAVNYMSSEIDESYIEESADKGLAAKAKASGVSLSTLRTVYKRGVAAWNSGHRPGTTPQQWGMARVNSYITKGKGTYHGADKDLREDDVEEACWKGYRKFGMKKKGDRMVPDCRPVSEDEIQECNGNCTCGKDVDEDSKGHKSPSGGLTQKGRDYYNRKTGSNLKAPVTTEPSKLKKGSKSANRRKSFCARMGGMKKRLTSAKTANDPDSRINKALRKWNC
jgi:hypothetical protein